MDENTFGKSQSAKDLSNELRTNYPHLIRRVGKLIHAYDIGLQNISDIVDKQHKIRIATMWRKYFIEKVNFHPGIDTFVKNIIVAKYRDFLKSLK